MFRRFFLILAFFIASYNAADESGVPNVKKEDLLSTDSLKNAALTSADLTRHHLISIGFIFGISNVHLFISASSCCFDWPLSKVTIIRNIHCEAGIIWEVLPFFGCAITFISKEFWNFSSNDYNLITGVKLGLCAHLGPLFAEGGILVKNGHSGLFKVKNYGIGLYVSCKVKKDMLFIGGSLAV